MLLRRNLDGGRVRRGGAVSDGEDGAEREGHGHRASTVLVGGSIWGERREHQSDEVSRDEGANRKRIMKEPSR